MRSRRSNYCHEHHMPFDDFCAICDVIEAAEARGAFLALGLIGTAIALGLAAKYIRDEHQGLRIVDCTFTRERDGTPSPPFSSYDVRLLRALGVEP